MRYRPISRLLTVAGLAITIATAAVTFAVSPATSDDKASTANGFVEGLIDQHGRPVAAKRLLGKPTVFHFGFTHCPVVCPTTLNEVATLMADLGPRADRLNFVFITVDPERDTASVLKTYIGYFDERIIGLTGSEKAIAAIAKSFKTTYAKRPHEDGYNMDHAIFAYLTDRSLRMVSTLYIGSGANRNLVRKRIDKLLGAELSN
ncbi:MAG: SCO family protein [Hyphomicrobiaceae bacterium]